MTDNEKTADPELEKEQKEIRQRLVRRIAVAIGLIGVAAISLPLLDKIRPESRRITPPPATDAQTTRLIGTTDKPAQPAPPALDTTETASAAPQQKPAEPVTTTEDNAADQAPAPPENPPSTGNESQPGQPISDSSPKTNGIRKQAAPISAAPPSEQPVPASKPQPITTQPLATKRPEAPRIEHPKPTAPTNPIEPIAPPLPARRKHTHPHRPADQNNPLPLLFSATKPLRHRATPCNWAFLPTTPTPRHCNRSWQPMAFRHNWKPGFNLARSATNKKLTMPTGESSNLGCPLLLLVNSRADDGTKS